MDGVMDEGMNEWMDAWVGGQMDDDEQVDG